MRYSTQSGLLISRNCCIH